MRLLVRGVGWVFVLAGVFLVEFLVYELWYTDQITATAQTEATRELEEEFTATTGPEPTSVPVTVPDGDDSEPAESDGTTDGETTLEYYPEEWPDAEGEPIATISIPDIDLESVVFSGVSEDILRLGPGAMPGTSFPGQVGNATVSGHRTTYGSPFHNLDQLDVDDEILVETAVGIHTYEVRSVYVVEPTDVWVTDEMTGAWLSLTACHPKWSAAQRIIVQATMIDGPNAPYAQHLAATEPPIRRSAEHQPLEVLEGEF